MAKKNAKPKRDLTVRPPRAKLTEAEIIRRMESLPERAEKIIAALRKSSRRSVSA